MIRTTLVTWLSSVLLLAAADSADLLRFTNGDQLHGKFEGIKPGPKAVWQRDDLAAPVEFQTSQLRHVVLRGGRPERQLASLSNVTLVNGDRVPGVLTAMNDEALTMETDYGGTLRIPRDKIAMLAPSPLGGRLHYHGPFTADEWKMINPKFPDGLPPAEPVKEGEKPDADAPGRWGFSGSAWYWPGKQPGTALIRENAMPDRAILRFDIAWKNRLALAVGFHADFKKPKTPEADDKLAAARARQGFISGDSSVLPSLFGNSYVLQIYSTHLMLFRTMVDDQGVPSVERVQISGNSIRLGDAGKTSIEIRSNRLTGSISLFINEEFVVQWSEGAIKDGENAGYAGKGSGFGFVAQSEDAPLRIDDVIVAEWNGMPDSARSLQMDDQDIVLLANGTDRFSGKVGSLENGKLSMDAKYGQFQFQLDDIAEVRLARNKQAKPSEPGADELTISFSPLGRISGKAVSGTREVVRLVSPIFGEAEVNLRSAVMLDFQSSKNIADDWDVDY